MAELIVLLLLIGLAFGIGTYIERSHYADIRAREARVRHLSTMTFGAKRAMPSNCEGQLFVGNVVVSADYFKVVIGGIRSIFGGRLLEYESVLDRARREALLRMKEAAIDWGADRIANVRLETAELGNNSGQGFVAIEVSAYGTAIRPVR